MSMESLDRKDMDAALAMTMVAMMGGSLPYAFGRRATQPTPIKKAKCGLPGCDVQSERDYCCAEHCRQHKQMNKETRK